MEELLRRLRELRIELALIKIDASGYYLPIRRTIVANSELDELELKEIILHELEHILSHAEFVALYNESFTNKSKMEYEVNLYMISELIKENDGYFNYSDLIETYNLGFGSEDVFKLKYRKAH